MKAVASKPLKPLQPAVEKTVASRTATVADLRNHFRRVSAWIENGETVEIVKRGRPFAQLAPLRRKYVSPAEVDWEGQAKAIWRGRVFTMKEVEEMRAYELGEEA